MNGVEAGFTNPIGQGTGASNIGARAGGGGDIVTDNDTANVFVSWGFVGGIAYVILIFLSFKTVFRRYLRGKPDPLLLAVAGLMFVTFGQWLNGGHYATSALLFFMLGWAVRPRRRSRGEVAEEPLIPPELDGVGSAAAAARRAGLSVGVLVPSYRRPEDLGRCLEGLAAQIRLPDEVMVVVRDEDAATWEALDAAPDGTAGAGSCGG